MDQIRPTFGAVTPTTVTTTETTENKEIRPEVGAIWQQTSKNNNEFLNIRLKLSKKLLKELLETSEEEVAVNLIAFPNRNKEGISTRPSYRIYEEKKRV